ncbi:MAG: hypothetical protein ACLSVD_04015 [Eggerthellaceae bacterium]
MGGVQNHGRRVSQGDEYLSTAGTVPVRVYYSIAPGVGFANIRSYDNGNGSGY